MLFSSYLMGSGVGFFLLGFAADRFGRMTVGIWTTFSTLLASLLATMQTE